MECKGLTPDKNRLYMKEYELSYQDLDIKLSEVYDFMGYHDAVPDEATQRETEAIATEVSAWLRPRFGFVVRYGMLDAKRNTLAVTPTPQTATPTPCFTLHHIIARQLQGSEAYALFVATAGMEFENFQRRLTDEGDMVRVFIANALGSVIAERCADKMEDALQTSIDKLGWHRTARFSPGYCGWHVAEQQILFSLLDTGQQRPCGIQLTDSSLMVPIKSVSGIIGVGHSVAHNDYTCGLCDFQKCYKKRKRVG